jgi:hypothetical protein
MAKFKGSVYESTRAFVQHEFGAPAVERILASLPAADRELLSSVTAIAWIPVEPVLAFHRELEEQFGGNERNLAERAGRFSAGWSMNSVLKMFVRFRSPLWLVDKGANVWSRYHALVCARLRGWLRGVIELTGGNEAEILETRCRCRGHDHCAFLASWKT